MAFKFVVLFVLIAIGYGKPIEDQHGNHIGHHYAQPVHYVSSPIKTVVASAPIYHKVEHEAPAHYDFSYSVHDEHTGDIKSQKETRQDDVVKGYYELVEPDGHKRTVHYTADKHSGFNAVVSREPTHFKVPVPAPKLQVVKHVAPVHYVAPVQHASILHTSPAVHHQVLEHNGGQVSFHGSHAQYAY